jgi:hypothetical protein
VTNVIARSIGPRIFLVVTSVGAPPGPDSGVLQSRPNPSGVERPTRDLETSGLQSLASA